MIDGVTTINHKVRAELNLSLQEYVVMDFLNQCMEKGLHPSYNSINMIALEFDNVRPFIPTLESKGLLVGYVPTKKWTSTIKKAKKAPKKKEKKPFVPPSIEEVIEFFKSEGYNKILADKFYKYYSLGEWKDSKGKEITFWKRAAASWCKDEHKISTGTGILIEQRTYNR